MSRRVSSVGGNGTCELRKKAEALWKLGVCLFVWVCVFSPTVANAFFTPTTCGDVGGHASWSTNCFKRSLSDVMDLRADFMIAYTEKKKTTTPFYINGKCGASISSD